MSPDDYCVVYVGGMKLAPTGNPFGFSSLLMYPQQTPLLFLFFWVCGVLMFKPQRQVNATDSKVFWVALYAFPVLWLLLALVAILKFQFFWLTIVSMDPKPHNPTPPTFFHIFYVLAVHAVWKLTGLVVALILNMANVLAFTRCDKDQKRKWATGAAAGVLTSGYSGFGGRIVGAVLGRFFG
jgi:Eukaryotic protein of unknown function (DUF846)